MKTDVIMAFAMLKTPVNALMQKISDNAAKLVSKTRRT
jgi:hypothetical protein